MTRRLVVFEDERWRWLRPLTDVLPVPALAFGGSTLLERWRRVAGASNAAVAAREGVLLAAGLGGDPFSGAEKDGPVVAINAAALPGPWLEAVHGAHEPSLFRCKDRIAAAILESLPPAEVIGGGRFDTYLGSLRLPPREVDARVVSYPWDLVSWNAEAIAEDLATVPARIEGEVHSLAAVLEPGRVRVERGARVDPYAVLDAREGPIQLGEGVVVAPHTVVVGPCVVGRGTHLLGGLVARSTIGPECRIAGEVDECIWQGYANKRHHGFVGHSLVSEWVNLGALTTTSDLKNNYGTIRVHVEGREVESGVRKMGAVFGAHVKTGIGTLLPTGAWIGVGSNLFGGGRFAPKLVPSFGWWDGSTLVEHRLDAFLGTARTAARRRGRTLDAAQETLLRMVYEATAGERSIPREPVRP